MIRFSIDYLKQVIGNKLGPAAPIIAAPKYQVPDEVDQGDRHTTLFKLMKSLKIKGLTFDAAFAAACITNKEKCNPPIDERELRNYLERSWQQPDRAEFMPKKLGIDTFPYTEAGDAEFFSMTNADIVRFDHRSGYWMLFTGHRWMKQTDGEVNRLALDAMRARQRLALKETDSDKRKRAMGWTYGGETRSRLYNMLTLAQSMMPIANAGDNWDKDPWLLGVQNGVIDLRTGLLRDGKPDDLITKCCSVSYDPQAECPLYERVLSEIFEAPEAVGMVDYWHRFTGYSITGDCREEAFAICWGEGGNGKGTLINTIAAILGDYSDDLPFSSFELQDRSGIPNDMAKIDGKRFVTASEASETKRLNEARIKALTGRDPITARFLHKEFFTFTPMAKYWLSCNPKPKVQDTSAGFWRRVHMIAFAKKFDPPDLTLKDRIRAEGAGILARMVKGCLAWQAEGLKPPPMVLKITAEYRGESSPLSKFIEERCVEQTDARCTFEDLFKEYLHWAGHEPRMGKHELRDALLERYPEDTRSRTKTFIGIGLMGGNL